METMPPCYKCEDRHLACHDSCEQYKEWKHALEIENAAKRSAWQEKVKYTNSRRKRMMHR